MISTVKISEESAEILQEAAKTLRDDIISGRQWGFDDMEAEENAGSLEAAIVELSSELNVREEQ